jgi:selenocysteine lyase/cysteine desulfurase
MPSIDTHGRRDFLASFGLASAAVAAHGVMPAAPLQGGLEQTPGGSGQRTESEYLLAAGLTYLNTAALGPSPRSVLTRTLEAWYQLESNPVQMAYGEGALHVATDRVREQAATFLGCTADELLITRSTTDAMNTLVLGMRLRPGDRVLMTNHEHEGAEHGWTHLTARQGIAIDVVNQPMTDYDPSSILKRLAAAITPDTRVISVSHVTTSNGVRMPIAEIAALARARGILSVVDGAQAVGHIPVNVRALGCDAYAASGHKWLMGPKGTGFLYVRREAQGDIAPVQQSAGSRFVSQANGMGSLPLVIGVGAAIEAMTARSIASVEQRILALRSHVYRGLTQINGLRVLSPPDGPVATALVAAQLPDGIDSATFMPMLREKHGVVVKRVDRKFFNGIRLSAHIFNTEAEIDRALRVIREELV